MFLEGRSDRYRGMVQRMEGPRPTLDFETAAQYRDRVAALKHIQEKQYVVGESGDADCLAVAMDKGTVWVESHIHSQRRQPGSRSFFPQNGRRSEPADILAAFLPQYYLGKPIPERLYTDLASPIGRCSRMLLGTNRQEIAYCTADARRPERWVEMAQANAQDALRRRLAERQSLAERFEALRAAFELEAVPERVECFDVSHTFGEATVASCVVFDRNGPVKSDYRRFNIEGVEPGDDYGAMTQALTRRYRRSKRARESFRTCC